MFTVSKFFFGCWTVNKLIIVHLFCRMFAVNVKAVLFTSQVSTGSAFSAGKRIV